MSKATNIAMFITGAALGSVVTWRMLKKKYEQILQEEIESIKEAYNISTSRVEESEEVIKPSEVFKDAEDRKKTMQEYAKQIAKERYSTKDPDSMIKDYSDIHVISPDEFSEFDDYYVISLTYFADGRLADDDGNLHEIDETIGVESLEHFGDYEEDCVHVRNNEKCADYEVLLDHRKYSEVYPDRD